CTEPNDLARPSSSMPGAVMGPTSMPDGDRRAAAGTVEGGDERQPPPTWPPAEDRGPPPTTLSTQSATSWRRTGRLTDADPRTVSWKAETSNRAPRRSPASA